MATPSRQTTNRPGPRPVKLADTSRPAPARRTTRKKRRKTRGVAWAAQAVARGAAAFLAGPVLTALVAARTLVLFTVGAGSVAYGAWLMSEPAGFITGGIAVLYGQWLLTTDDTDTDASDDRFADEQVS